MKTTNKDFSARVQVVTASEMEVIVLSAMLDITVADVKANYAGAIYGYDALDDKWSVS